MADALRQNLYVKVAGGSEPASYTWTLSGDRRVAGGITTYSGVDTDDPIDAHGASTHTSPTTAVAAPSVTTTVPDTLLVHFAALNAEGTLSAPSGMTERWEAASPRAGSSRDALASSSDAPRAATGSTGPRTATASQAGRSIGALLALRPDGSGPPPPPPPVTDPVLVGAGDIASCVSGGDEATAALLDGIAGIVFTAGDNVYDNGTAAEFDDCYDPSWGRHRARTKPSAGNHDYNTPGAAGYYGYFGAAAGDPAKGYYDYALGSWHVIVLNSNCSAVGGCGLGSPQGQWLQSVLAASTAPCTVAYWHQPRFSSAVNHGSDATYQPFWQALYDAGADLVLAGHDHVYERFAPQTPTGQADPSFGIRQFTIGTGGRSLYNFATPVANSQFRYNASFGVLALTLHAGSYDWRMIRTGNAVVDSGTGTCHDAPATSPSPIIDVGSAFSGSSSARSSITVTRPPGTQAGHVMVASIVSNDDDPNFTAPAGWALVRQDTVVDALRQNLYVKVAGGSEPSSYTWTLSGSRRVAGGITTYSGVDTADPIDAHGASTRTSPTTAVTAPSITTSVADTLLVHFAAINAEGTLGAPSGMAERWEAASPKPSDSRDALASSSDAPRAATGPTGTRTATASQAGRNIGALLALRPARS